MTEGDVDVLMITYERPHYTKMSLERLLDTCDESMRVWLWHNGDDEQTRSVTESFLDHPNVARYHHSPENVGLRAPTNWLWEESDGALLSKVDDDCILAHGWAQKLRSAHADVPELGVVGCWRFQDEDFIPWLARRKIREYSGGHRILRNTWVQGSGYLMKRACVEQHGLLGDAMSFTDYCDALAARGWTNGFFFPFIREDHMDDPRSPNSALRSDDDLLTHMPLSARNDGVSTVSEWQRRVRWNAWGVQAAPLDPSWFRGWRGRLYRRASRAGFLLHDAMTRRGG